MRVYKWALMSIRGVYLQLLELESSNKIYQNRGRVCEMGEGQ